MNSSITQQGSHIKKSAGRPSIAEPAPSGWGPMKSVYQAMDALRSSRSRLSGLRIELQNLDHLAQALATCQALGGIAA